MTRRLQPGETGQEMYSGHRSPPQRMLPQERVRTTRRTLPQAETGQQMRPLPEKDRSFPQTMANARLPNLVVKPQVPQPLKPDERVAHPYNNLDLGFMFF